MPELPDVEGFRRYMSRYAKGRRIQGVEVLDSDLLRNTTARALDRTLEGRPLERASRHGKWLIGEAGGPEVLMHFGMTGLLHWSSERSDRHVHDRVVFRFEEGELRYRNLRKFGGVWVVRDRSERESATGPLGPDAMQVNRSMLEELLARRRGRIKPALMDQSLIAGLGNLLVDEILWRSRIHPLRPVAQLQRHNLDRIHETMHAVLREANRHARVPPIDGWLTKARDERDPRCPRDGSKLRKMPVGGRTTCWCARCQRP